MLVEVGDQQAVAAGVRPAASAAAARARPDAPRPGPSMAGSAIRPGASRQHPGHRVEREAVAVPAEPGDGRRGHRGDHRVCRHGSRAAGLDRCSSTTGPSNAASASWSDQA